MPSPEQQLKQAVKQDDLAAVRRLLAEGVDANAKLPGRKMPLEFALAEERHAIAWELIEAGARPRVKQNENLLIDAPKLRDLDLLRRLVELGADVNAADRAETTPLLAAAEAGFYAAFEYLLAQGADPLARNWKDSGVREVVERTRVFCRACLKDDDDGEFAEQCREKLADLDRIEQLFERSLSPEKLAELRGTDEPAAES